MTMVTSKGPKSPTVLNYGAQNGPAGMQYCVNTHYKEMVHAKPKEVEAFVDDLGFASGRRWTR